MIPLQLLRVRITKKGKNIVPVFCTSDNNDNNFVGLQVATKIIEEFEESYKRKEKELYLKKEFSHWNLIMTINLLEDFSLCLKEDVYLAIKRGVNQKEKLPILRIQA